MTAKINMITLIVSDLERAVTFYKNGLRLTKMESPFGMAFFMLNGAWLGLSSRKSLEENIGPSSDESGFSGFTISHNVHSEKEVEIVLARAISAGGTLVKPPQKASLNGYSGYFRDPDGHLWEIAHNSFFLAIPM